MTIGARFFSHNCEVCEFLGSITGPNPFYEGQPGKWDLYVCRSSLHGTRHATFITRYGDEGSAYLSALASIGLSIDSHPALLWARALFEMREYNER